jgi:hypothetical protein
MSEVNHADRGHSEVGASSASRWLNCPASVVLIDSEDSKDSIYAAEGTAAHELSEHCFLSGMSPHEMLGMDFKGFEVTEEMADAVGLYLYYLREKESEGYTVYIENSFEISSIDKSMFGTCDAVLHSPFNHLIIADFKYGKGVGVEAKENKQLSYYGVGVCDSREGLSDVDRVTLCVIQPRLGDGKPIKEWDTTPEYLDSYREVLRAGFSKVLEAKAQGKNHPEIYNYAESGSHCRWCTFKPKCKKLRNDNFEVCKAAFKEEDTITLPHPSLLNDEDLAKVFDRASIIQDWVSSVKAYALMQLESGKKVEGFKLVKKRANRAWIDESNVIAKLGDIFDTDQIYTKKLKSPAQLEKLVGKQNIEELTHKPATGNNIARDYDSRQEQKPQFLEAFEEI